MYLLSPGQRPLYAAPSPVDIRIGGRKLQVKLTQQLLPALQSMASGENPGGVDTNASWGNGSLPHKPSSGLILSILS
jgi:hypothetical protein